MKNAKVAIMMGSINDLPVLKRAMEILDKFSVPYQARVLSAHRTPHEAAAFAENAEKEGFKVMICAAGMAAHLAGVVAAHTTLPVIGVPLASEPFNGIDSLLAMTQMPPGIPVATVTAGKCGADNAALLAVAILALSDTELNAKLKEFRKEQTKKVLEADRELQNKAQ